MRSISLRAAGNVLLIGLVALAVFHLLIIMGALPTEMVWGGQFDERSGRLIALEVTALLITGMFGLVAGARSGYLRVAWLQRAARVGSWILFAYFALNVLGNLASSSGLEKAIFVPVSVILAVAALRLALEK